MSRAVRRQNLGAARTTPLCEITITNGGWIIAANGDRGFGGNAKSNESGQTQGQEQYQDHGPIQPLNVHSINVLAIVCEGTLQASIFFGQATVNGSGTFTYRINVRDLGEPGAGYDTYWLLLQTGYNSGQQVLRGGNVHILSSIAGRSKKKILTSFQQRRPCNHRAG